MVDRPVNDEQPPVGKVGLAKVRRRPNIAAFLVTGGIVGVILGVLYSKTTGNGPYSTSTGTGYVALIFGVIGVLIAALAVIVLDKRADRR